MKRTILAVLLTLTFLTGGVQTVFAQADPAPPRGHAAPIEALPEDLQGVDIKDYYLAAAGRPAGVIRTVIGHVVVLHEDTGQAYFAAGGDDIFKHDVVFTLKDSRCRLKFTTDDIITMGDNARIGIEEYIDDRVKQKKTSVFSMLRGKAMFYALRLFKYRTASSSVKTPTAIIGVRGTQFGVEVRKIGSKMATGQPVYLADASDSGLRYLLSVDDPSLFEVITHCFDGIIDTFSVIDNITTVLTGGQSQEVTPAGAGAAFATPEDVAADFSQATAAPDPDAAVDEGQPAAPPPPPAVGEAPEIPVVPISPPDDVTQLPLETQGKPRQGYFAGMLSDLWDYPYLDLDDVYVSSTRQDFNLATVRGDGIDQGGFVDASTVDGYENPTLKQVRVHANAVSADNLGNPVIHDSLGSNTYMEWGWWYVADPFIVVSYGSPIDHDLKHKGYYIFGDPTPCANVAGISGYYSGPAYGTYYNAAGGAPQGIDMTGAFNCNVDGAAGTISGFFMSVSGGGKEALITGASGTFNSSSFDITGGTWLLDSTFTPVSKSCHGSLYGPGGEHIGGAWGMYYNSANGAAGIFKGSK